MAMYTKSIIRETANAVIFHYLDTSHREFGQWIPKSMGDLRFRPRPFVLTTLLTVNKRPEISDPALSADEVYQLGEQIIFDDCLEAEEEMVKVKGYHPYALENELCICYIRCLWASDYQYSTVDEWQLFVWFDVPFYSLFDSLECAGKFKKRVQDFFPNDFEEKREELIEKIVQDYGQFLNEIAAVVWRTVEQQTAKNEISDMVDKVKKNVRSLMNVRGSEDA